MSQETRDHKRSVPQGRMPELHIPDGFECPILREIMTDPVLALDGHSYERAAIEQWFRSGRSRTLSPMTGQRLASRMLLPNHSLRKAIEDYIRQMPDLDFVIKAQVESRDLMLAIQLAEADLATQMEKLSARGESKLTPSSTSSQEAILKANQEQVLGYKTIALVDAMVLHIRQNVRGQAAASSSSSLNTEAYDENTSKALTYVSSVVRALSKGAGEYNQLTENSVAYAIPQSMMQSFVGPYVRSHGLMQLMQHSDFARQLSIDFSYASQADRPADKKDLSGLRATFTRDLSERDQVHITRDELTAAQSASLSPAASPGRQVDSAAVSTSSVSSSSSSSSDSNSAARNLSEALNSPGRTQGTLFAERESMSSSSSPEAHTGASPAVLPNPGNSC